VRIQALAYRYQVTTPDFANPPDTAYYYEDDNRMIVRDFSKCVHVRPVRSGLQ